MASCGRSVKRRREAPRHAMDRHDGSRTGKRETSARLSFYRTWSGDRGDTQRILAAGSFPVFLVPHGRPIGSNTGMSNWMFWPWAHFEFPDPEIAQVQQDMLSRDLGAIRATPDRSGNFHSGRRLPWQVSDRFDAATAAVLYGCGPDRQSRPDGPRNQSFVGRSPDHDRVQDRRRHGGRHCGEVRRSKGALDPARPSHTVGRISPAHPL
jgi:hypothetical protein